MATYIFLWCALIFKMTCCIQRNGFGVWAADLLVVANPTFGLRCDKPIVE